MKDLQIVYMDGYDEVRDIKTQDVIFSTKIPNDLALLIDYDIMRPSVIDNVVNIWNKTGNPDCLGSQGELDEYLLNEGRCTQDEREIIVESLYDYYYLKDNHNLDFAKFEEWMNNLPTQTLTDELKREILEYAVTLIDM